MRSTTKLAAALLALAMVTTACGGDGPEVTAAEDRLAEPEAGADSGVVFTDPAQLLDQEVEVRGVVTELVGDNGALLTNPELGSEEILVVASGADAAEIRSEAVIDVAGTLQALDPAEVTEAVGEEFDTELLSAYEGDPVIVAETIRPAPEEEVEG